MLRVGRKNFTVNGTSVFAKNVACAWMDDHHGGEVLERGEDEATRCRAALHRSEGISRMSKVIHGFFSFQESFFGYCYRGFMSRDEIMQGCLLL